ncbi:MAG: DUF481 domain-containing protein [Lentisphaeria bacterium]
MSRILSWSLILAGVAGLAGLASLPVAADEVVFQNGDKLTGTVKEMAGGKLVFASAVAGDVTLDLAKVKSVSTEAPVTVELANGQRLQSKLAAGTAPGQVVLGETAGEKTFAEIARLNPPLPAWHGSLAGGATFFRGNSKTDATALTATAFRRSDTDRITLNASYINAREMGENDDAYSTTQDAWNAEAKYDYFFAKKWYAYGDLRYEHDRIAKLDWRYSPNAGVGYQWFEQPDLNFSTEGGLGWVFEKYKDSDQDDLDPDHPNLRLAYHFDKAFNQYVSLFHNLEYLPSLSELGDYTMRLDAGVKARLTAKFFVELKYQMNYNSNPPSGTVTTENWYVTSVGWDF